VRRNGHYSTKPGAVILSVLTKDLSESGGPPGLG
jgi:hypothetical protein